LTHKFLNPALTYVGRYEQVYKNLEGRIKGRDHLDKLGVDGRMLKLTLGEREKDDFDYIDQVLIQTNDERL